MIGSFLHLNKELNGLISVMNSKKLDKHNELGGSSPNWSVYNIGNSKPVNLIDYITHLENALGIKAKKEYLPMQQGDMQDTYADVTDLVKDFNYRPITSVEEGVSKFANWYVDYYKI